jgi:hypothetical protein
LLLSLATVRGQAPQAPTSNAARDTARQLEAELEARHAKLQELVAQHARLAALIEALQTETLLMAQRLQEAKARLTGEAVRSQRSGASAEERLERLEKQVQALQHQLREIRSGLSGEGKSQVKKFTLLDLQPYANQKLNESMGSGSRPGNTLASLPAGRQQFLGIPFQIGEGLLQLGSTGLPDKPERIKGIRVGHKLAKLHFLHAAAFYLEEETPIGSYTVHYADGSTETIPILNAKDVSDWWKYPFSKEPTQGKVAWQGVNDAAKEFDATLQLFLSTWVNPKPDVAVTHIDYASTMKTPCGPFCVAITAEQLAPADPADKKLSYVDLQPKANQKLADNFGRMEGNNLASLPRGERTFEDVKFKIGDSLIQLGSELLKTKPQRLDDISVGKAFARLHILHATVFGRGDPEIADDALIAKYEIHYEGGDTEEIPVVYGKDVRDWWYSADEQSVSRGQVAWKGENEVTKDKAGFQRPPEGIRLYLSAWKNPHPTKRVLSIDYVKVGDTPAVPFCVAITLEEK